MEKINATFQNSDARYMKQPISGLGNSCISKHNRNEVSVSMNVPTLDKSKFNLEKLGFSTIETGLPG